MRCGHGRGHSVPDVSSLVSLELHACVVLIVTVVGEMCKAPILLYSVQRTEYEGLEVLALAACCSEYHCVAVPCLFTRGGGPISVRAPVPGSFADRLLW